MNQDGKFASKLIVEKLDCYSYTLMLNNNYHHHTQYIIAGKGVSA